MSKERAPQRGGCVRSKLTRSPGGGGWGGAAPWVRAGTGAACWAEGLADLPGTGAEPQQRASCSYGDGAPTPLTRDVNARSKVRSSTRSCPEPQLPGG